MLSQPALDQISFVGNQKPVSNPGIPTIDLSKPESKTLLVKACEEFGFFNHGIPLEFIDRLGAEAVKFFSLPQSEKEKAGPANLFGYGNNRIGPNGDVGWIEYLLFQTNANSISQRSWAISRENPEIFCSAVSDYISAVKKLACGVLGSLTEGQKAEPSLTGFGERTDPQIISVLRSNNTSGLQISLSDGSWVSVPPDHNSFVIVGDSLQNGLNMVDPIENGRAAVLQKLW
ncbi:gibberellin 2-beta-dioxygenase 1-like [Magnolia sinica]|uniref:gibberellin 2-beta-dioxygenase 1-like n=1 Tax=Magnolia sinica TaxID=86752 RepID=UPI002659F3BD|nr:gibberellin 2-beta-dioxygenase 1-like [Magnolia sinica]